MPVAIAVDAIRTGCSVINDCTYGTTRNTVETITTIAAGWGFAYGGI